MAIELWDEVRSIILPKFHLGVIIPGTNKIRQFTVKNTGGPASDVRVGVTNSSSLEAGGRMLFDNNWIFGRELGETVWLRLSSDILVDSVPLGSMIAGAIRNIEIKISIPGPQRIASDEQCRTGELITKYEFDLPSEFILKFIATQK